jgi:hypothetical protein
MAKGKKRSRNATEGRTRRAELTAEESLKRMEAFPERKEQFVAAVRKSKDRSVPA